jgi:hypothetical protein
MQFTTLINNACAVKWGMTLQQAAYFAFVRELPSWADQILHDGDVWFFLSRKKVLAEIPLVANSERTVSRLTAELEALGVIERATINGDTVLRMTAKADEWRAAEGAAKTAPPLPKVAAPRCQKLQRPAAKFGTQSDNHLSDNQDHKNNTHDGVVVDQRRKCAGAGNAPVKGVDLLADVNPQTAADFIAQRKTMRAPLTATAVAGLRREAEKAGLSLGEALAICCERGWRGFKAEWVERERKPQTSQTSAAAGKQMQGIMALEEMKNAIRNRMAAGGDHDGAAKTGLPVLGSDTRR